MRGDDAEYYLGVIAERADQLLRDRAKMSVELGMRRGRDLDLGEALLEGYMREVMSSAERERQTECLRRLLRERV